MRVAATIIVLALLAPVAARAQEGLGRRLEDPRPGERTRLSLVSDAPGDRVTIDGRSCVAPCTLQILPGTYDVEFRSGPSRTVVIREHHTLVAARPTDEGEQILGVVLIVAAASIFASMAATVDLVCWDFETDVCSPDLGPALLGVGLMAVVIGVGLVFDGNGAVGVSVLGATR